MARLTQQYPDMIAAERAALRETWERIKSGAAGQDELRRFGAITHDIKGQAASFGYPLAGRVAETLSLLFKLGALANPGVRGVIEAHIATMEKILDARIAGDGGTIGAAILAGLRHPSM